MQFRRLPDLFSRWPIRSSYELWRNLALLGCDVRVLTTDASRLDAVPDVEKDKEGPFEEGVRVRYCHRHLRHSVSAELVRLLAGRTLCTSPEYTTSPRSRRYSTAGC